VLLHIGNTAARWTTVNPWVVGVGVVVFLAVAYAIWRPFTMHRLARRLGRPAITLVVAIAVLPAVLPYDHLLPAPASHAAEHAASEVHAAHCHVAPGSCADAPVSAGLGQFLATDPLLLTPALVLIAILLAIPLLAGITMRPITRPPLGPA
jgi:hypothetical protein